MKDKHKVVIITGGVSGVGKSITLKLAKAGYHVYATTRKIDSTQVKELLELTEKEDLKIYPIYLDLTKQNTIDNAIEKILEKEETIDVLINNSGSGYFSAVEDIEKDRFISQMETNVWGTIKMAQAVIPQMRKQGEGKIINMSSILGFSTAALNAPYSASKYALESVSETLALEVKPFGIDVIILQIGDFHSDFLKNATRQSYTEKSPYYKLYKRQDDRLGDGGRGKDPIIVANKIVAICNKKRHPLRYMIGKEVFIKKIIHSLLPGKDWVNFLRSFYNW